MKRKRKRHTNYIKTLDKNKVWVKTGPRGIRVVEMYGFVEKRIMDMPNEIHIEGFYRMVNRLFTMLGINNKYGDDEVVEEDNEIWDD